MPYEDRIDKLVEKIRESIKNVRFDDLKKILEAIGYECVIKKHRQSSYF